MGISDWWKRTSGKADVGALARDLMARARLARRMGELDYEPAGLLLAAGAGHRHRRLRTLLIQLSGHESVDEARHDLVPRAQLDEIIATCTADAAEALTARLAATAPERFVVLTADADGGFELHDFAWPE